MRDLVILGTDTDAGKTTFALLWLAAFGESCSYWKPLESGDSDSQKIQRLLPGARIHAPLHHFEEPVAPMLAARRLGQTIPDAETIAAARPNPTVGSLVIETFGSPFSPLNETEIQTELIRRYEASSVLVSSSAVGAIGRTLQCLRALLTEGVMPMAVVMIGESDAFAEEQIARISGTKVFSLSPPVTWDEAGIRAAASVHRFALRILDALQDQDVFSITRAETETGGGGPPDSADRVEQVDSSLPIGDCATNASSIQYSWPGLSLRSPGEAPEHIALHRGFEDSTPATSFCTGNAVVHKSRFDCPPEGTAAPLLNDDRRLIWHPYTSLHDPDPPLPVISAQDEYVYLADGRSVIDGISSWWTILHGHRYPPLVAALNDAAKVIDHVHFAGVTHPWAVELAELLLATAPWKGGRVFYSDNGSTAVEVALKMSYQYWQHRGEPQRKLFIGFENGYHGDTFGAMSVGRDPVFFGRFEPLLFRAEIIPLDANRLGEILARHRGDVAAVIVEPLVQGAGGMRMHSPEQLQAIFEATREHDVLFIADEVMTGARTGPRWAFQSADISPDLICASKTLTGGMMPLAATLASPRIVEAWETDDRRRTFFHGHSFTAHPLACAVAVANCRLLPSGIDPRAARMESFWHSSLAALREHSNAREVRIRGSIAAIELLADGGYLAEIGRKLRQRCLDSGVLLRPLGNVLYTMPPLNASDESLDQISKAMIDAVNSCGVR